jgi:uncharacterized tellurite resistance protein B-like protein
MGMFDGFSGGNQIQLNPQLALAAGLVYVSAADGHLAEDERYDILKVVPDDNILRMAQDYCRRTPFGQYLQAAASILSPSQKLCMILNLADMAMGDGHLAGQEAQTLMQVQQAFGIPDETLRPQVQTLMAKNNLSVFGW